MVEQSKVVIPEEIEKSKQFFNAGIKKGKILCRVWLLGNNGARDKLIGQKKVSVGKTSFEIKGKLYWINYNELKEEKKYYVYDCSVLNAVGALSFHEYTQEKVYPNQAEMMLKDGQVKTFMGKGGIPVLYLLVAFIVVAIALAGMMYLLSQTQTNLKQIERLTNQNTALANENAILKQQLGIDIGGT